MKAFGSPLSVALGLLLLAAQPVVPAKAGLGESVASVQTDRASMKGQLRTRSEAGYTVQQITTGAGTVVKEFVSPSGTVFAVSWWGPAVPDLQQLLGSYYVQFKTAAQAQRAQGRRSGHGHLEVRSPTLIVHAGGHMRQYFGMAYAPALLPANLSVSDLH